MFEVGVSFAASWMSLAVGRKRNIFSIDSFIEFTSQVIIMEFSDHHFCRRVGLVGFFVSPEEVVWKTQSADRLKLEAEKCLAQSEKLSNEKTEFENKIYGKFVEVLNSKKAKLRQLRDRLSKQATASQLHEEEDESTDRTESFDEETDEDNNGEGQGKNDTGTSKDVPASRARGRKRK